MLDLFQFTSISLIILKFFFKNEEKVNTFFIFGYLFKNCTTDIPNSTEDLLILSTLTISLKFSLALNFSND